MGQILKINANQFLEDNKSDSKKENQSDIKSSNEVKNCKEDQIIEKQNIKDIQISNKKISIIISFWGNDLDRIYSTTIALKHLVNQLKDYECIFIEAQKTKSDCCFSWLKKYGWKHVFKKIPKESEYLFLKMPLWNIGVKHSVGEYYCFLDSDVYFQDDDWIKSVDKAFDSFDVLSLAGYSRQDNDDQTIIESIGHQIQKDQSGIKFGHGGFTLGMTRSAYLKYGKFDAVDYLDDQWFWYSILGEQSNIENFFVLPYHPNGLYRNGFPFKVGSTEQMCIHVNHGKTDKSKYYRNIHDLTYNHIDIPFEDIKYNKRNVEQLPIWNEKCIIGRVIHKCFKKYHDDQNIDLIEYYNREFYRECKPLTSRSPLVIVTIYRQDFRHKDIKCVYDHLKMIQDYCQNDFTYICFSNVMIDNIDIIKYDERQLQSFSTEQIMNIIKSNNIVYPKNANVLYIGIDSDINEKFNMCQCLKNERVDSKKYQLKNIIYFKI